MQFHTISDPTVYQKLLTFRLFVFKTTLLKVLANILGHCFKFPCFQQPTQVSIQILFAKLMNEENCD